MLRTLISVLLLMVSLSFNNHAIARSTSLFTSNKELPCSMINYLYQDSRGFIWIATENGLVRYDGARFQTYTHNPASLNSLAHDFISCLIEDEKGRLYVSSYAGVQIYDYGTNSFSENVRWEDGSNFGENINTLSCDDSGNVFSAGYSICQLSLHGDSLVAHKLPVSANYNGFSKIIQDKNKQYWVSLNSSNLVLRLDSEYRVKSEYSFPSSETTMTDFIIAGDGIPYAAVTGKGIVKYQRQTDSFEPILPETANKQNIKLYAKADCLYLTGDASYSVCYDTRHETLTKFKSDHISSTFADKSIQRFLLDRDDNAWFGIANKGVLMIPDDKSPFHYIGMRSNEIGLFGDNPVNVIREDSEGNKWIGFGGDGSYVLNSTGTKLLKHFSHPSIVTGIYEAQQGQMLVVSSNEGIWQIDNKSGKIKPSEITYYGGHINNPQDICQDSVGNVWIVSMGHGLFRHDSKTKKTIKVNDINPEIHKWIKKVFLSNDGSLYLGTYDGLERIDTESTDFRNTRYLKRSIVYDIVQGNESNLWVATSAGLFNMSLSGDTLHLFTIEDGLPSLSLASLQFDNDGYLWVSSNLGLSKIDVSDLKIVNFYSGDGLQGTEFGIGTSLKDKKGNLWFGGNEGVTFFHPDEVCNGDNPWHVRILALTLNNEDVTTNTLSGGKPVTSIPVFESKKVSLSHSDNSFSIYFATEELNSSEVLQFEYSFGDEDKWERLPVGAHSVSFSNLPSGSYTFMVRAAGNQRGSTISAIDIEIRKVWYNTWWANCLFVLMLCYALGMLFLLVRVHYRSKNERMLAAEKEANHDAQTRFFIDITHEIRTPLMLIMGTVRHLLANDQDNSRHNSYSTLQRNANRILKLMEEMIDIRRVDKGVLNLHFVERDLVETLKDIYEDFSEQAKQKQITFDFNHEGVTQQSAWVDANYFDKIVINLVSNALKYTSAGGKVSLSLIPVSDKEVRIAVSDNGQGIPAEECERIFDRFYRGHNAEGTQIPGSGIGLSLTRSLVELHHGSIKLVSRTEAPTGSTFTVTLPLGHSHLSDSELGVVTQQEPKAETIRQNVEAEEATSPKSKYNILVVDDEYEILNYLSKQLSSDFNITCCGNGQEALQLIQKKKIDLVVSDVMMPVMGGETLCQKIRRNIQHNTLPIILLTALTDEDTKIAGLDSGADEYMTKPVSINLLRSRIYNLLHKQELLYNNFSGRQDEEELLETPEVQSPDKQLMERIMRVINSNLDNQDLNVEMLADNVGISRVHLNRKLKELTNQTPRDFIRNIRLKQAAVLLSQGNVPISQVSYMVGFSSNSNFTVSFRQLYGMTPKEYRESQIKN